jgi:hypothetical protein
MTKEQCLTGLIALAKSSDPEWKERTCRLLQEYLVGRDVATGRNELALEFRDRTEVTDRCNDILDTLAGITDAAAGGSIPIDRLNASNDD